ncbi:hypothetical protein [Solidesulfovibrio sp.]|uniref:hypothetical protein n=1 Tax=Solidesulfovibrio sp. TaxID=2910990 RepID=UPI00262883ED|nr:hypothetical protein [Solidesulfovibrio sp.]
MSLKEFGLKTLARHALRNDQNTELLRSELYSLKQLNLHAVKLAGQHALEPRPGPDMLLPRLADNARVLRAAYDIVTATTTPGGRIAHRREERDTAIFWAQRMQVTAEKEPKKLILLLAEFANADVPLTAAFVEEFHARLHTQGASMAFIQTWIGQKLLEQGVTATQLSEAAGRTAATNQLSIANSIGSLRFIGAMDWKNYVESLSLVEQTLRDDPAGVYALQDFATRDRYRHVVEDVARSSARGELAVARQVLSLARAAAQRLDADDRAAHVGYYLLDKGRPLLERSVDCRLSLAAWAGRANRTVRLFLYLGPVLLLSVVTAGVALAVFGGFAPGDWRYWLVAITGLLGGSALAVPLVNLAATLVLPPRTLPRLDFSRGIPAEHRTMAVVPTLLGSAQDVDSLAGALEIRYLGNRDPNLFFALLTDFPDAPARELPGDAALLARARAAIEALNATYRDDRPCIFFLFHRPREWNPSERTWMGHERKRGKLEQFNALLRGKAVSTFSEIAGDASILSSIRYVITLDTDTQLPRDAARSLVGNMATLLDQTCKAAVSRQIGYGRQRGVPWGISEFCYNAVDLTGRGGWTWYTGAASWRKDHTGNPGDAGRRPGRRIPRGGRGTGPGPDPPGGRPPGTSRRGGLALTAAPFQASRPCLNCPDRMDRTSHMQYIATVAKGHGGNHMEMSRKNGSLGMASKRLLCMTHSSCAAG